MPCVRAPPIKTSFSSFSKCRRCPPSPLMLRGSGMCSPICWKMPSPIPSAAARLRCQRRPATTRSFSPWPTQALAFRLSINPTSSTSSSGCRARARKAAPAWALPLRERSSQRTAAPSSAGARSAPARFLKLLCRCGKRRRRLNCRVTAAQTRRLRSPLQKSMLEDTAMPNEVERPAPEHFLTLIRQQQRGRLKVYLGFAAGVGKTYEMLQEGQRLRRQGVDVVIGFVETHGRTETAAQAADLEQVPRRRVEYRGVVLEEMDLDAIINRHPTVALLDELAHTNAPGSRNAKRYQDVEELLRQGINVISTLNIQHLESLYDLVEQATGVKVKERIPDYVLGMADQLVNVDLSAEDLRDRLAAGKVYPAERIQQALSNFFTPENLTRLREMSLGEIAHLLDRRRREQNPEVNSSGVERLMVCLSSRSPNADQLLRKCSRMASRMNDAPWYAVYIETPNERMDRIDAATQRHIGKMQELAQKLGGVPQHFKGQDVVSTVAEFVKEYGITHILIGRSERPWYLRWFGQSILDRLIRAVPDVDIIVANAAE